MERIFSYRIGEDVHGWTAEQYLRAQGYSGRLLARLRRTDMGISVDGNPVYTTRRICAGETLVVKIAEEAPSGQIVPISMELDILYEDQDLMVISKPAGMPVHPSYGNYDNTLANAIAGYAQKRGEAFVHRVVNRLDRDTTGLLIVSKHMLSAGILSQMMANRQIHRQYLAIVTGTLWGEGTIDLPIAREEGSTIRRKVDFIRGERAVTHYRALEHKNGYTLVQLSLETGRTHQIRVHMTHLGYPLPGDFLYNEGDHAIVRQALHSWKLSFLHPITKKQMEFIKPMPEDMKCLLDDLKKNTEESRFSS